MADERAVKIPAEAFSTLRLQGQKVRLEPLSLGHEEGLRAAVCDGELWKLWYTSAPTPEGVREEIVRRLQLRDAGSMIPFAAVDERNGKIVGATTYMNIDAVTPRMEIGMTWYAASVQRTGLNTEAKRLLLGHAFEVFGCVAVEFRVHFLNHQSRRAVERLGAKLDGILRNHSYTRNGTLRDYCIYSVIASEWPAVREHLTWLIEKHRPPADGAEPL